MGRDALLTILNDNSVYKCNLCDRTFGSLHAIYEHCRKARVHLGKWCERCERLFSSSAAIDVHRKDSSNHHLCWHCGLDYASHEARRLHMFADHFQCGECSVTKHSSAQLLRHMEEAHHYCSQCQRYFENRNNLCQVCER
jgi:transcription elongation factor Elf1